MTNYFCLNDFDSFAVTFAFRSNVKKLLVQFYEMVIILHVYMHILFILLTKYPPMDLRDCRNRILACHPGLRGRTPPKWVIITVKPLYLELISHGMTQMSNAGPNTIIILNVL